MAANTNKRINIYINGKEVENKIGGVQAAYNRLGRELKQLEIGSDAYNKKAMEIQKLKAVLDEHNVAIGKTASGWDKLKQNMVSTGFGVLGGNMLTALTEKLAGFFGGMIDGAAKLSDQFADIQKTTGMSADEVENLNKELKKIDTRTTVSDLREIAIVAGQLGIEKDNVAKFAGAIDKINVALGDEIGGGAGVVAETVGKLRNVLSDMKSDAVDQDLMKLGNALNELGAAGFATAPVVAELSNRIGSIAIPLGFTSAQVMGLAATFQELNIAEERGGTAMGRILQKMTQNTGDFAKIAGMDIKTFTNLVNNDLYGAFMKVVEGSKKGGSSATLMSGIIKELEVNGAGASEVFMKLSGNMGMANEKVDLAAKALQNTDGILNEFNLKNDNFAGQMAKAGKEINGYFMAIGQKIAPVVATVVKGFADLLGWLKRNGDAVLFLGKVIGGAAISYVTYQTAVALATLLTRASTRAYALHVAAINARTLATAAEVKAQELNTAATIAENLAQNASTRSKILDAAANRARALATHASTQATLLDAAATEARVVATRTATKTTILDTATTKIKRTHLMNKKYCGTSLNFSLEILLSDTSLDTS
jgi:TP901 family phage tail tape measure protein